MKFQVGDIVFNKNTGYTVMIVGIYADTYFIINNMIQKKDEDKWELVRSRV